MRPVVILSFANDRDRYLDMINRERKNIFNVLQDYHDEDIIQVHKEESTSIKAIFELFNRYRDRIVIFHYGGHANGTHLQLARITGEAELAHAVGLAQLMGQQKQLQLVFLNGCATKNQVDLLLAEGVKAVIATSVPIDDVMAVEFAEQFYSALKDKASIGEAFKTAKALINSKYGPARGIELYRHTGEPDKETTTGQEIPWGLYINENNEEVLDWKLPKLVREKKTVIRIGPLVSKMCNRFRQVKSFWEFFQKGSRECPRQPHFYFIQGDELACHESFLERLMKTCLKEYAEKKWGEEEATIYLEKVDWPKGGNLSERQRVLPFNLMTNFNKWYNDTDFTASALGQLPCLDKRPLVLIKHNLYSSKWDKITEPLINWYIKEFWAALECFDNTPLFLIFFNIKYQAPKDAGLKGIISKWKQVSKKEIREQLEKICRSSHKKCPCLLLNELTQVEVEDVLDWLDEHNIFEHEKIRIEKAEAIFKKENQVVKSKPMADVEVELNKIIKEYQREEMI